MAQTRPIRHHAVAFLGEFVGTFLFLFFAFAGAQTANQSTSANTPASEPDLQQLLYVSLIFGFSLAVNVWVFFRVSGGLFNPAVTLALCITGNVPVWRSVIIFVAQIAGGIAASGAVRGIIPGSDVLFSVKLQTGTSIAQGLFLEMFLTAELVFTILMLAAEKTKATFVAPVGIGLALFVAELVGVHWTGGAVNPTRAFGPSVVTGEFEGYHWIYWLGPLLGALVASGLYATLKYLNYEEVNGDQDKTEEEAADANTDEEKEVGMAKQVLESPRRNKAMNYGQDSRRSHHSQRSQGSTRPGSGSRRSRGASVGHYQEYQQRNFPEQARRQQFSASEAAGNLQYVQKK